MVTSHAVVENFSRKKKRGQMAILNFKSVRKNTTLLQDL